MRPAIFVFSVIFACALPFISAMALERNGLVEISPFAGVNRFDPSLSDTTGAALGVRGGYHFNNSWGAELELLHAFSDRKDDEISLTAASMGALYHPPFLSSEKLSPYLGFGVGSAFYDYDNLNKSGIEREWTFHYGAGAGYGVSDRLSVRGDLRQIVTHGPARYNLLATVGVSWFFDGPKGSPPVAEKPVEPAPAPPAEVKAEPPALPAAVALAPKVEDGDDDGDGVPNSLDKCPGTPRGMKVDSDGCLFREEPPKTEVAIRPVEAAKAPEAPKAPVAAEAPKAPKAPEVAKAIVPEVKPAASAPASEKKVERLELSMQFDLNSHAVKKKYLEEVEKLAQFMAANPKARITIEGYADSTGEAGYNQTLSEKRAKSLARILIKTWKISPDRIKAAGYGETRPIAPNDTRAGRAKNRRVTAVVTTE
ncbi:OmpA family protein [bacterium]|nr:MAG: OmpA family protein [bacterium]